MSKLEMPRLEHAIMSRSNRHCQRADAACRQGADRAGSSNRWTSNSSWPRRTVRWRSGRSRMPSRNARMAASRSRYSIGKPPRKSPDSPAARSSMPCARVTCQLAALPVREFAGLGVDASLDPLVAPFMIDSLTLEGEVFKDTELVTGMVDEADDLDSARDRSACCPGLWCTPMASRAISPRPPDFQGASIALSPGEVGRRGTSAALGAEPNASEFNGDPVDGFDGLVHHLRPSLETAITSPGGSIATRYSPLDASVRGDRQCGALRERCSDGQRRPLQGATTDAIDRAARRHRGR